MIIPHNDYFDLFEKTYTVTTAKNHKLQKSKAKRAKMKA